jgi:hypothetical protein
VPAGAVVLVWARVDRASSRYATLYMLRKIREASPEEIRYFPLVREALGTLLKRERPTYRRELRELAEHVILLTAA